MGLGELIVAWVLVLASALGGLQAVTEGLTEGYTAICEAGGGTYQQSEAWDGQWECVHLSKPDS